MNASQVFEQLALADDLRWERIEVASTAFASLRRAVRQLAATLREVPEGITIAGQLQYSLIDWLSVPMPVEAFDIAPLRALGNPGVVRGRWGEDAASALRVASEAYEEMLGQPNPMRVAVDESLLNASASADEIRIYCHRTARQHFESLPSWQDIIVLANVSFLGTPADYRNAVPFEDLFRIGPLRRTGLGSVPNAVLNAPRFDRLVQVVWSGCPDEPGVGDDPVLSAISIEESQEEIEGIRSLSGTSGRRWATKTTLLGDSTVREIADGVVHDDFVLGAVPNRGEHDTRAVLIRLAENQGILHAAHSSILCLRSEKDGGGPAHLEAWDIDQSVTHIVVPELSNIDFGQVQALNGRYANIWKERLRAELSRDHAAFCARLHRAGVTLDTLPTRAHEWIEPASTVIRAPQQRRHFEILIEVLGIESDAVQFPRPARVSWATAAWMEIARSRGEAIQFGMEVSQVMLEELDAIMRDDLALYRELALTRRSFSWRIPDGRALIGEIVFHGIDGVSEGYRCPLSCLKTIMPIGECDQWRG